MKKVIFSLIALAIANTLFAQFYITSRTDKLSNCTSKSELVCSDNNRYVTVYNKVPTSPVKHKFIVYDTNSPTYKEFYLNTSPNQEFNILDIELKHGICYFCGTYSHYFDNIIYYPGIGWGNEREDIGFIGYFNINDALSGAGTYSLVNIDETEELSRLSIEESDVVYAVGYPYQCPLDANNMRSLSCIVCLNRTNLTTNRWHYDVLSAPYDGEMLTDIAAGPDGIYTVSRFQGDNYTIGVRHAKNGPLRYQEHRAQIDRMNKFNTQGMGNSTFSRDITWRENYSPIFVDNRTIGHVCSTDPNGMPGLMIYRLNLNGANIVSLSNAQYIHVGQNSDLLDLKDNYYANDAHNGINYVCMLIKNPTNNQSAIKIADWAISASCLRNDLYCWLNELVLSDIVPYKSGRFLFSVGHEAENLQTIENHQDLRYFQTTGATCLYNNSMSQHRPVATNYDAELGNPLSTICLDVPIDATSYNFASSTLATTNTCIRTRFIP